MVAEFTFGTVAVFDATTDKVKEDATGGKLVLVKDGPAQPIFDLNASPISQITSNPSGQSSQFRANIRRGLIQFGSAVVTVFANEVADELDQLDTAVTSAQAAQTSAAAASTSAAQSKTDLQAYIAANPPGGGLNTRTGTRPVGQGELGVLSVRDFGAVGDGTTDDTAAIQAALNAAAGKIPVLLPRPALGTAYVVSGGGSGAILLKVSAGQVLMGDASKPIIRVKAGTGNYKSIIGGATGGTVLSGLMIRDLTIDQNCTNNLVSDIATLTTEGTQRFVVFVGAGNQITVRTTNFINIDTVNVLYIGSPTMKDVRVQDCEFDVVGASTARHDHSTIYTSCDGTIISGNKFRGVLGGLGAASAIETHGPNQVVTGNRVHDFYRAMNITGVESRQSRNVVVTDNICRNVMVGIDLWSYAGSNGGLYSCRIEGNVIDIVRDPWIIGAADFPNGINVAASSTGHIENLKIRNNIITFQPFSAAALANEYQAAGIQLFTIDTSVELRSLDITDNTVIGALSAGLAIRMKVRGGTVARNRWVNCGSSTEPAMASLYKTGMVFVGDFADLDVYGNRTSDTRATHILAQGFSTSISGSMVRGEQWDNKVVCTDGALVPESAQTFGKAFATRPSAPVVSRFTTSLYYGPEGARSTVTPVDGSASAVPFWVSSARSFDRIGCEVTVAGAASSVVRLGIYADNGSGTPGVLILDAGTVAGDSLGTKEITVSQALSGGLYWLVAVGQGGTPQLRAVVNNLLGGAGVSSLAVATGASPRCGYTMTGTSGALPGTFTSTGQTALPGLVVLRAADNALTAAAPPFSGGGTAASVAMPATEPVGFTRVWSEDFMTPVALGGITPLGWDAGGDAGRMPVGHPYRGRIKAYVDNQGYAGDQGNGRYYSSKVLSMHNNAPGANGVLDHWVHYETVDGVSRMLGGWTVPDIPFGEDYTFGRWVIRIRADPAQHIGGAHLTISRNNWPADGERDFPEGQFNESPVKGYNHFAQTPDTFELIPGLPGTTWNEWHVHIIEAIPGRTRYFTDGVLVKESTDRVPTGSHQYVTFQSGISAQVGTLPAPGTQSHVQIDWATAATWTG